MNRIFIALCLFTGVSISGCGAQLASVSDSLPMQNVTQCHSLCTSVNMSLGAVVVVANQTGCVCEVTGRAEAGGTSSVVGGAVAQIMSEQQQRQQQSLQQQQQQQQRR